MPPNPATFAAGTNPQKPDVVFGIDELLKDINLAFLSATQALQDAQGTAEWKGPVMYCMPKMQLTIQLSLTYSENKVKGILWSKTSTASEQHVLSTIQVELVAVPRSAP